MIPLPFEQYLPKLYRDDPTSSFTALAAKANGTKTNGVWNDAALAGWKADVLALGHAFDITRTPSGLLDELGYTVGADLITGDSEDTKRLKIANAIKTQKHRGLWAEDVKLKIDSVTGFSSAILDFSLTSDWIMFGGGEFWIPGTSYAGSMGADGFDSELGLDLIGGTDEADLAGVLLIDVGTSTLTADQVALIISSIKDSDFPCYFRGFLGYISGGSFVKYSGGQIG